MRTFRRAVLRSTAFEFSWLSFVQYGRDPATWPFRYQQNKPLTNQLPQLNPLPQSRPADCPPEPLWQTAKDTGRDAWNRVEDALLDGSQPKSSAH